MIQIFHVPDSSSATKNTSRLSAAGEALDGSPRPREPVRDQKPPERPWRASPGWTGSRFAVRRRRTVAAAPANATLRESAKDWREGNWSCDQAARSDHDGRVITRRAGGLEAPTTRPRRRDIGRVSPARRGQRIPPLDPVTRSIQSVPSPRKPSTRRQPGAHDVDGGRDRRGLPGPGVPDRDRCGLIGVGRDLPPDDA